MPAKRALLPMIRIARTTASCSVLFRTSRIRHDWFKVFGNAGAKALR
jgi:hypothetical protein